jgi:hypothetical protein
MRLTFNIEMDDESLAQELVEHLAEEAQEWIGNIEGLSMSMAPSMKSDNAQVVKIKQKRFNQCFFDDNTQD